MRNAKLTLSVAAAVTLFGCAEAQPHTTSGADTEDTRHGEHASQEATAPSNKLGDPIPTECRGFSFDDLLYSPGGNVLPNKCQPFHPTYNNPYAVRCVDAWPWYKTPYRGDEFCILPPPPDKGMQVGFQPQGEA